MTSIIDELRGGKVVTLEGISLRRLDKEIGSGDMYVAERNTGPKLLWCRLHNRKTHVVFPTTCDYAFDTWECVPVEEVCSVCGGRQVLDDSFGNEEPCPECGGEE